MKMLQPQAVMLALAAMLTFLLAAEWLLPSAAPQHIAPGIPAPGADAGSDAAVGQWADTILARPIFNQDRRPPAQADSNAIGPLPRLTAIIIAAGIRRAVFSAPAGKPLLVGQGGAVSGYRLKGISAGSVTLIGPDGGITTLRPQFLTPVPGNAANTSQ